MIKENGPVLPHTDLYRYDGTDLTAGPLVILFNETHYIDAVLTQGGTNRWGRRGLAGLQLELDDCA